MGGALLRGWKMAAPSADIRVVEPQDVMVQAVRYRSAGEVPLDFKPALVVIALKPQQVDGALPDYARFGIQGGAATFLSIAAGKTLARLESLLGEAAVVRAMPNTPAAVGKGISVCVANRNVSASGKAQAEAALQAGGKVEWVADEGLMDAVTALSGSGPAYVFYLVEVLAAAGAKLGLDPEMAMRLARQTVIGSGHLLEGSEETAAALRVAVTSPGGTTAAALAVLQDGRVQALFDAALKAAEARGQELAKG